MRYIRNVVQMLSPRHNIDHHVEVRNRNDISWSISFNIFFYGVHCLIHVVYQRTIIVKLWTILVSKYGKKEMMIQLEIT